MRSSLEEIRKNWKQAADGTDVKVDAEDVAYIVSRMTGVPIVKLEEEESKKLLRMEDELRKRVVGQDEALCGGLQGDQARQGRPQGPQAADRIVLLPRADRCRQDRAGAGAGGVHVRR